MYISEKIESIINFYFIFQSNTDINIENVSVGFFFETNQFHSNSFFMFLAKIKRKKRGTGPRITWNGTVQCKNYEKSESDEENKFGQVS
jgi:hypothetical protein